MKIEIWTIGCSILLLLSSAEVSGQCLDPAGDVNGSGSTDVLDVQCIILTTLYVLSDEVDAPVCLVGPLETADVDCSGEVDVVDAILEVKLALLLPFDVVTDADDNGCPDACEAESVACGDGVCDVGESCDSCDVDCGCDSTESSVCVANDSGEYVCTGALIFEYTGSASIHFDGSNNFVSVRFQSNATLSPDTYYGSQPEFVSQARIRVVDHHGFVYEGFDLPIDPERFKIHTDSSGSIDAWSFWEDDDHNTECPCNTSYRQIYTYSTSHYLIPGFTGHYPGHDQATQHEIGLGGHHIYSDPPLNNWTVTLPD